MPLSEETLSEIDIQVRSAFDSRDRIIEIFTEEMYAPGDLDPDEIAEAVDVAITTHERSKLDWPQITDWDRLDQAFHSLRTQGVISLHNAGYTQSDGFGDFVEALHVHHDASAVRGYCFYHGQDTERAVQGEGLFLAFGPSDQKREETDGPAVGRMVAQALTDAGFTVAWNGSFRTRILIPDFDWKKR
jgi:hypothetical protein